MRIFRCEVLFCVLGLTVTTTRAKNSYLIVTPKEIRPGVSFKIGIHILKASADVQMQITLVDNRAQTVSVSTATIATGSMTDITINVPSSMKSPYMWLKFVATGGLNFVKQTNIKMLGKKMSLIVQTDRGMYKAGHTVRYRAFSLLPNMTVQKNAMDVEIYDPKGNKIKQWLNLKDDSCGVIENFMVMGKHPVLGTWKIKVKSGDETDEKTFEVQEYKLPNFEVVLSLPEFILPQHSKIQGAVKATYTYGKPVSGTVLVQGKLLNSYDDWENDKNQPVFEQRGIQLNTDGRATFTIPLASVRTFVTANDRRNFVIQVDVTDDLTNSSMLKFDEIRFSKSDVQISFEDVNGNTFKPGLTYSIYVLVTNVDGSPFSQTTSKLIVERRVIYDEPVPNPIPDYYIGPAEKQYSLPTSEYTIPNNGRILLTFDAPDGAKRIYIEAKIKQVTAYRTIFLCHSPSKSYIQLLLPSHDLTAQNPTNIQIQATKQVNLLSYQIWSKGSLVVSGTVKGEQRKTFSFTALITSKMAPSSQIVAYYVRDDGEIVFDSVNFNVKGVFQNKVTITSDKSNISPGDNITITVNADSKSLVNLVAVDQSALLIKSNNDITEDEVLRKIKPFDHIRTTSTYPVHYSGKDMEEIIGSLQLNVLTDAEIYRYVKPVYWIPTPSPFTLAATTTTAMPTYPSVMITRPTINGPFKPFDIPQLATMRPKIDVNNIKPPSTVNPNPNNNINFNPGLLLSKPVDRVRSKFIETWIWSNKTTGNDGIAQFAENIPDTITSWIVSAFAVNPSSGLGISQTPLRVTSFRPFFISLTLPYSVIRGEVVIVQVNVYNYLQFDNYVIVILKASPDFIPYRREGGKLQQQTTPQPEAIFVSAGRANSVFFPIVPIKNGLITLEVSAMSFVAADGLRKQLIVEPEGLPVEKNKHVPLILHSGQTFDETLSINMPSSIVNDSERMTISVAGDFLGPTITNLDRLVRMPTGCGEQTMISLAPDVFVTDYLKKTNQLTHSKRNLLLEYMEKGVQNELRWQRTDGSFSVWGNRDTAGSMWLSAFVTKIFMRAKEYIQIDSDILNNNIRWILKNQNSDGSFSETYRVYHTSMQGGSASGIGLTAFVLIAMEDSKLISDVNVRDALKIGTAKARSYLERKINGVTDNYVLAITSYALYRSGSTMAQDVLVRLNSKSISIDGMTFWKESRYKETTPQDIEMTAYALLSFTHLKSLDYGLSTLKWLIGERNANGGFKSTQDTVVALQAMSEFTSIIRSHHPNLMVTVTAGSFTKNFTMNNVNALVLQSVELEYIPRQIDIKASGRGLGVVQISTFYNIDDASTVTKKRNIGSTPFQSTVSYLKDTINLVQIKVCTRRMNNDNNGMVLQEIGIPTGFEGVIDNMENITFLRTVEEKDRKLVLYYDEMTTTSVCVKMTVSRIGLVANMKPSLIRVYDYYRPSNEMTTFYNSKVLENSSVCDICPLCRPCRK